jgi:dipeptidyl aminopeptidase/acylaminoacyl peptidase
MIRRSSPFAGLALILFALVGGLIAAPDLIAAPLTPTQLLDIAQVRSVALSPDGRLAACTVSRNRTLADEPGGAWVGLEVVDLEDGTVRPFVSGKTAVGRVQFSPDGRFLSFTSSRGEDAKTQVWVLPVDGGEAQVATASPTGVTAYAWSPDAATLYYVDTEAPSDHEKTLKKKGWLLEGFEEGLKDRVLRRSPFSWGAPPAEAETLVAGLAIWSVQISPDGRWAVFGASARNLVDEQYVMQDFFRLDLETGEHALIVDAPGKVGGFAISPDSERIAWTGAASRSDHATSSLYLCGIDGSNNTNITLPDFPGHIRDVVWRDEKTLLYRSDEGVYPKLSIQQLGKSERRILVDSAETGAVVASFAARPGVKNIVFAADGPAMPREMFVWPARGGPKRVTFHNAFLADVDLGEQRVVRWNARDGLEIEGILTLPVGHKEGQRFPLVVQVHGGPESNEVNGWYSRYSEPGQVFAGMGIGTLLVNYRGSTGRGIEFAALAYGDPAGAEFDDIVDGVDHLIAEGLADPERVGVTGGSYGGYATNWLSTVYSDRFAAGVAFVGPSEMISKRFLTNIPYEDEWVHMGRPVRESWDLMTERSPVFHADKSRTPLLILHGDRDHRVHFSQAQVMFRALKMAGHPAVRLIYYPGEGHGNAKRFGRADYLHRTLAWFDWYLLQGKPWDGPLPPLDITERLDLPLD